MRSEQAGKLRCTVRVASDSDADEILRLWQELMRFHEDLDDRFDRAEGSEAAWRAYLGDLFTDAESFVFVAEAGSAIVGFISGSINEGPPVLKARRFGWVSDAHVDGDYRRQGIGERLFERAREWFCDRGIPVIQLNVSPGNPVAESFWRKMGFRDHLERLWLDLS